MYISSAQCRYQCTARLRGRYGYAAGAVRSIAASARSSAEWLLRGPRSTAGDVAIAAPPGRHPGVGVALRRVGVALRADRRGVGVALRRGDVVPWYLSCVVSVSRFGVVGRDEVREVYRDVSHVGVVGRDEPP